jgi:hypothetical protein
VLFPGDRQHACVSVDFIDLQGATHDLGDACTADTVCGPSSWPTGKDDGSSTTSWLSPVLHEL